MEQDTQMCGVCPQQESVSLQKSRWRPLKPRGMSSYHRLTYSASAHLSQRERASFPACSRASTDAADCAGVTGVVADSRASVMRRHVWDVVRGN